MTNVIFPSKHPTEKNILKGKIAIMNNFVISFNLETTKEKLNLLL